MTNEMFIEKARKVHGDKYDYSKVVYKDSHEKVCIVCPEHGEFWQTPTNHLCGKGCKKCGNSRAHKKQLKGIEKFIKEAKAVHGNKYDYSKTDYINAKIKVIITCPEHGDFLVTPDKHLGGQGCPKCSSDWQKFFIEKAKKIHGDKYDYSKMEYVNSRKKICIICPEHGEFFQTPERHLKGGGCPVCLKYKKTEDKISKALKKYERSKLNNNQAQSFIKKAKELHDGKYDYSKVDYVNSQTKVCIICPEHGEFFQTPNNHLNSKGCPKCAGKKLTLEERLNTFRKIHGNKYDYSKVDYVNAITKICIICPEHGEFWITPNKHLSGRGCPLCSKSILEMNTKAFLDKNNIIYEPQKTYDWLILKKNQFLDFYLPEYNIAIECQGAQHLFEAKYYFGHDNIHSQYVVTIERDKNKKDKCSEHGIEILYLIDKRYKNIQLDSLCGIYTNENTFYDLEELKTYLEGIKDKIG